MRYNVSGLRNADRTREARTTFAMHYHAYKQPAAGWQGYIETKAGKVSAWVAVDGTIVPSKAIK